MFTSDELRLAREVARTEARYASARGTPQPKHWAWLFNALYAGSRA